MPRNGRLMPIISRKPKVMDVLVRSFTSPSDLNLFRAKPKDERRKHIQAKTMIHISVVPFKSKCFFSSKNFFSISVALALLKLKYPPFFIQKSLTSFVALSTSRSPSFCIRKVSSISIPSKIFNAANMDRDKTGFR